MPLNVGTRDRWFRVALGTAVLLAGLLLNNWWGLLGLLPLASGLFGWCPIYALCGTDSREPRPREAPIQRDRRP